VPDRALDAIGQQFAVSTEIDATLQHVADLLVPQFADHCFIDLFEGNALICRVRQHAGGWTPPPGTWKLAGEQIRYPQGHFCQMAMDQLESILVADLADDAGDRYPPPSAPSMAASKQVRLRSVVAAPLYARGSLLGVLAVARSELTGRTDQNYAQADRDLISAVAGQIAIAIDNAVTAPRRTPDRPGPAAIAPATS
jgi:GAF domain-containing protein